MFSRVFIQSRYFPSRMKGTRFYRRKTSRIIDKIKQDEMLGNLVSNSPIATSHDVNSLKNKILSNAEMFKPQDIDRSLIIYFTKNKQFDKGLSYIRFLSEDTKNKLNLFLINQQFIIYFHKRYTDGSLSTSEQELIVQLYANLKKTSNILDSLSLENTILGLSVTPNWTLCLTLFNDLKKLDNPSSICYSAVIATAFLHGNEELAWNLWREMFAQQKTPYDVIFKAYFDNLKKISDKKEISSKLNKLFEACNENNFLLYENSILDLQKLLNSSGFIFSDSLVNNKGYCNKCGQKLKILELGDDAFESLKKKFFEAVIVGKNIFNKTNPAELSKFQEFLGSVEGYNVVIDGLNVAYIAGTKQSPEVYSTLLAKVVSHFVEGKKKVIVLGRKHMESWPQKQWSYIRNNARVFLTQDISLDDPYLLYCAIHCGKDAILISRDLMRSHLFALKDPKDKIMFSRWLEQRQFQVTHVRGDGKVFFKSPRSYTRIVQYDNNNWHIPFTVVPEENEEPDKVPEKWLCVRI